ncbi:TnpV protein [[Ruminococcus] torques]|uniref:TnpV protein n=1 Tax=[Ruminococcus] torques TaxID=33039 RepID=UPI001FAA1889|nr:TnpV protein [[Ruminococcus] torques]
MTLFEELGVEYKEVDGILYPLLSVDEAEYNLTDIGKYGRMWLRYMKENKPSEYRHMARMGQLRKQAELLYFLVLNFKRDKPDPFSQIRVQ